MNKSITLKLQRLGKRKIKFVEIDTKLKIKTLKDLIIACVSSEVDRYNDSREDLKILPFLTPAEIQQLSDSGKVSFGDIEKMEEIQLQSNLEVVFQAFADGLFVVFIDDIEIGDLNDTIFLNEECKITFLRLTFLTGTFW